MECISCKATFTTNKGRRSHQTQTADCRWVIRLQEQADPAPLRNYLADSDQEEDPPIIEANDPWLENQDVFATYDETPPTPPLHQPSPRRSPPHSPPHSPNPNAPRGASVDDVSAGEPCTVTYQGAGKVLRYDADVRSAYQASTAPMENTYHPFNSRLDWDFAKWATEQDVSQNAITKLLAIPGVCEKLGLSYRDSRSLNQTIDELPGSASWQTAPVEVHHETYGTVGTDFFFRDALEGIKSLYSNPAFIDYMSFAPEKQYSDDSKDQRLYNEMQTGNWWWQTQIKLPDGATVVPIVLSSDKTQLTIFNVDQTAYPIYMSIGNIAKDIRRKPSLHAQILIGYLPTPKLSDFSEEAARTVRARLFHAALTIITQSLKGPEHEGVEVTSADGAVRRCHPVIAVYVADYPEQALVTCTRQGSQCPKCHAVEIEFEDHNLNWRSRKQDATLKTLRHGAQQSTAKRKEAVLKGAGLTHVEEPFWKGFRYCNIHDTISPDILHQLFQGLFQYIVAWVSSIVGTTELDARFKRLPRTHGVCSFDNGISCLSRISAGEHKEICKQLLGCIIAPASAIRATRALLDFIHLAQYESHSDATLSYLQASLNEFHKNKKIFLDLKARTGGHFNLPKLHAMQHYVDSIRERGTTDNYNTEATERLHIDYAKDAYRATNKKDYLQQMVRWLDRKERVAIFVVHVHWRQNTLPPLQLPRKVQFGHIVAKRANHRSVTFSRLHTDYHAQHFSQALQNFIVGYCKLSTRQRRQEPIAIPFNNVQVWDRVKFRLKHLQVDGAPAIMDTAVAVPSQGMKSAQFDTVLVVVDDDEAEDTGIDGLRVGRLRVIFQIPSAFNSTIFESQNVSPPGHLAYVEWYSPFAAKRADHRMYPITTLKGRVADVSVVEITDIRRSCQLIPEFGERANRAWTRENVLDRCKSFFVNNFVDKYTYQTIY